MNNLNLTAALANPVINRYSNRYSIDVFHKLHNFADAVIRFTHFILSSVSFQSSMDGTSAGEVFREFWERVCAVKPS